MEESMEINSATDTKEQSLSILKNKSIRRLGIGQFLAVAATYAIFFSSIAFVEEKTHSSAQMGVMIFAIMLPGYMMGMLAGVFVDRVDRRHAMVIATLVSLLAAGLFSAGTKWTDHITLLLVIIYSSNFILSALVQFTASARDSIIPNAVRSEDLFAANSIVQVAYLGAQALGTVLLSPILFRAGGTPAVGLAAIPLFALAALAYARLPQQVGIRKPGKSNRTLAVFWADLKEGWQFVRGKADLSRAIAYLVLVSALVLVFTTLLPGLASRVWGIAVENVMVIAVPGGLGFALGLWLVGRRGHLLKVEEWISAGLLILGGGLALISLMNDLHGAAILMFLIVSAITGVGFALVIISARSFIQEQTPDELRGRVMSTQMFLCNTASTLPLPIIGGLADAIGIKTVFVLLGFSVLGAGVISARITRSKEGVKWA
jgi:DHA3 family macrolide efflux protein-like MFS transporter